MGIWGIDAKLASANDGGPRSRCGTSNYRNRANGSYRRRGRRSDPNNTDGATKEPPKPILSRTVAHRLIGVEGWVGATPSPTFDLAQILFYSLVAVLSYSIFQWATGQIREHLDRLLLECQQGQPQELATAQGQYLAVRPKILFLKKIILLTGGACFAPSVLISALQLLTPLWLSRASTRPQPCLQNPISFDLNPWRSGHFSNCSNIKFWGAVVFYERGLGLLLRRYWA